MPSKQLGGGPTFLNAGGRVVGCLSVHIAIAQSKSFAHVPSLLNRFSFGMLSRCEIYSFSCLSVID